LPPLAHKARVWCDRCRSRGKDRYLDAYASKRDRQSGQSAPLRQSPDRLKKCPCGERFPVEYNSRGQMTSRKWCDTCRLNSGRDRWQRKGLATTAGLPRCADCGAIADLRYASIAGLDTNGHCPSCARAFARLAEIQRRAARGEVRRGGTWVRAAQLEAG